MVNSNTEKDKDFLLILRLFLNVHLLIPDFFHNHDKDYLNVHFEYG